MGFSKKNFKKDGSIYDRYFNINSKKIKNSLWFVIYQDEKKPAKIDKNIVLFNPKSNKINFINVYSIILENIKFLKFNKFKIILNDIFFLS